MKKTSGYPYHAREQTERGKHPNGVCVQLDIVVLAAGAHSLFTPHLFNP